jgi:antitoxin (DNA-binding transcriptional repressor) of toxin-antitoxin stability system
MTVNARFGEITMTTVSIEQAQATLPILIAGLLPDEDLVITQNARPVARLTSVAAKKPQPTFGNCQGKLIILSEDDEHLEDFKDYMP